MIKPLTISGKTTARIIALSATVALFSSCFSNNAADLQSDATKHITDLTIGENSESLILTIEGDRLLTYAEIKQALRQGLLLYFPSTRLAIVKQTYVPPDNEIISAIEVDEILKDQTTTSSIFIALKRDATHGLKSDEAGLHVSFSKIAGAAAADIQSQKKSAQKKTKTKPIRANAPPATELIAVVATESRDHLVVEVTTDGAIRDYRSFVIDNPPRIVFDLYKIRSPYKKQQDITVTSKWAKRIRNFGYPEKVRLVLETHSNHLSNYSALPTDTGLPIYVGKTPAASTAFVSNPD